MPQQISMERALDAARERIGQLTWENVLLTARIKELEGTESPNEQQAEDGSPPSYPQPRNAQG